MRHHMGAELHWGSCGSTASRGVAGVFHPFMCARIRGRHPAAEKQGHRRVNFPCITITAPKLLSSCYQSSKALRARLHNVLKTVACMRLHVTLGTSPRRLPAPSSDILASCLHIRWILTRSVVFRSLTAGSGPSLGLSPLESLHRVVPALA